MYLYNGDVHNINNQHSLDPSQAEQILYVNHCIVRRASRRCGPARNQLCMYVNMGIILWIPLWRSLGFSVLWLECSASVTIHIFLFFLLFPWYFSKCSVLGSLLKMQISGPSFQPVESEVLGWAPSCLTLADSSDDSDAAHPSLKILLQCVSPSLKSHL